MRHLAATIASVAVVTASLAFGAPQVARAAAPAAPAAATCVDVEHAGIPHPATVRSGIPGFHAEWYGQTGYPWLCPGHTSTATVAYYNSGTYGWTRGKMGESAYLGTWDAEPGQDRASPLGGDGTTGSPNTGWPRYNRIAIQPDAWVGPNQVAWFQFTIKAPTAPGWYRLYLRPLIEGATWMEDFGVYWVIVVLNPDGSVPAEPAVPTSTGYSHLSVPTSAGSFDTYLIKERLSEVRVRTVTATTTDCYLACPAKPLADYATAAGAYAAIHGSYFCPPDYQPQCAGIEYTFAYAVYNSSLGRWMNGAHLQSPTNALASFNGSTATFYRRVRSYTGGAVTAGISNFPLVLSGGQPVDVSGDIDSNQGKPGARGVIAVDGTFVYLAVIYNATVPQEALVMQALGARDAMNLDGGGSIAMWINGSYVRGPGRQLPNAILLLKP